VRDEDFVILASHLCLLNWMAKQHIFEFAIVLAMEDFLITYGFQNIQSFPAMAI
jgi:hypothetical protein